MFEQNLSPLYARQNAMDQNFGVGLVKLGDLAGITPRGQANAKRAAMYERAFGKASSLADLAGPGGDFNRPAANPGNFVPPTNPGKLDGNGQPESRAPNAMQTAYQQSQPAMQPMGADQGQGLSRLELAQIMQDPYADEGEKTFARTLLAEQMKPKDPYQERMAQLDMALKEQQLRQAGQPKPQNPTSDMQEYELAKSQGYKGSFLDYQTAVRQAGATNVSVGGPMKLTEQQSKDLVYYNRGANALAQLEQRQGALANTKDAVAASVPVVGNFLSSAEYQLADQAGREFLASILRKDTGAAVTPAEMDVYGKIYLPRPGDAPEVLAQKVVSRKAALEAIRTGLGTAEVLAVSRPEAAASADAPAPDASSDPPPPGVDPGDWQFMTPEDRALWR